MATIFCKHCGNAMEVGTGAVSVICAACGTQQPVYTPDAAIGFGTGNASMPITADKLFAHASLLLRLRDADAAKAAFEQLARRFPGDARGWFGLALCKTDALKSTEAFDSEVALWFSRTLLTVEGDAKKTYEAQIDDYLAAVSAAAEPHVCETVRLQIRQLQSEIRQHRETVEEIDAQIKQSKSYVADPNAAQTDVLAQYAEELRGSKAASNGWMGLGSGFVYFFLCLICLGGAVFTHLKFFTRTASALGAGISLILFFLACFGAFAFRCYWSFRFCADNRSAAKKEHDDLLAACTEWATAAAENAADDIEADEADLADVKAAIEADEARIAACEQYLALDAAVRINLQKELLRAACGLSAAPDKAAEALRTCALGDAAAELLPIHA